MLHNYLYILNTSTLISEERERELQNSITLGDQNNI